MTTHVCSGRVVVSAKLGGTEFCCRPQYLKALYRADPEPAKTRASIWNRNNPERRKVIQDNSYRNTEAGRRDYWLQTNYGISLADYDSMVIAQCGLCAVCGETETKAQKGREQRLSVHHDHDTGVVIALLCHSCNRGMGLLRDDPVRLLRAANLQSESRV